MATNKKHRWRIWLNGATLIALLVLIVFVWPDITDALQKSQGLNIWALFAMLPLQVIFYFTMAQFFYHFFKILGHKVGLKILLPAVAELNFVNHVFPSGGVSGFSYFTWRLKPYDVSVARSTLAQLGRFGFIFIIYIVLMFISLFLLAAEDRANGLVVLVISIVVVGLAFSAAIVLYVLASKTRIVSFTKALAHLFNKIIYFVYRRHPETLKLRRVETTFMELHEDFLLLKHNILEMRWSMLWMFLSVIAELSVLYAVFVAHGTWVNPGVVVVGLVIASIAGLIAALPGGLGVFEPIMSALFIGMGVSPGLALSVTLIYRIISLFFILILGYPTYQLTLAKYGKTIIQRK